jgi:hypothetical protein
MTMSIQTDIATILVKQASLTENPLKSMVDGLSIQEVCYLIFHSYRGNDKSAKGMRLSDMGLNLLKAFFKCNNIKMPGGTKVSLPQLLYLDRVSTMPYWISNEYIAIFDTDLGMMLALAEGNINLLIESRFRLTSGTSKLIKD